MSNILVEYESGMPTVTSLRKELEAFQGKYDCKFKFIKTLNITRKEIEDSDIVLSIRGTCNLSAKIAAAAKKAGRMHIAFYDDDLMNLPVGAAITAQRAKTVSKLLSCTDLIFTPNKNLGKKYANLIASKRYVVEDTAININDLGRSHKTGTGKVKLLYAANKMHVELFNKYIMPVMPELCERFADKLSMTFIGVKPDLSRYQERMEINYIDSMPLEDYRRYVKDHGYDIGIAPLHEDEFSRCKYFNKFIEYTLSGTMGVYTKCEPYTFIVEDKVNGFLTENTEQGWLDTLTEAITNESLRQQCLENAQNQLINDFNESSLLAKLAEDIPEFITFRAPQEKKVPSLLFAKLAYLRFRFVDILTLTVLYYKKSGVKGVIKKIREHISESKKQK